MQIVQSYCMYLSTMKFISLIVLLSTVSAFRLSVRPAQVSTFQLQAGTKSPPKKTGAGFNYDASNYKDSNDGNYRRLGDQLAAVKAEEEALRKERDELIRKEQMAAMMLKRENDTFWNTPPGTIVANSEKYFIAPEVLQVIDDLDNELIGLKPVKEKLRRYAASMLVHKIRE